MRISSTTLEALTTKDTKFHEGKRLACGFLRETSCPSWLEALRLTVFSNFEHRQESFLGNIHAPDALHSPLALFLFLEKLSFPRNIATVALRNDVLANRRYCFARNNLRPNG